MPIKIVPKNDGMDEDQELDQFGGFGREAVEEAAKRPTYASTQGQVDDRDRREAAVAGLFKKTCPRLKNLLLLNLKKPLKLLKLKLLLKKKLLKLKLENPDEAPLLIEKEVNPMLNLLQ
jgi:hypothetical protein